MERRLTLRLIHTVSEQCQEEVDVYLDREGEPDRFYPAIRRHFVAMASRDAERDIEDEPEDMPWLHLYHLDVCEGGNPNDVLLRFREG